MRGLRSPGNRLDPEQDGGFTLVEAVIALAILGLVASGFTVGMNLALQTTRDARLRQQATHLAEREVEIARDQFRHADATGQATILDYDQLVNAEPLPGGTAGQPLVVDGTDFTVTRTQTILTSGDGASPCDGAGSVDYLTIGVHVAVSWQDGGRTHEVDNRTLLTPVKGVEGDVGYLAAKLTGVDGGGTANVPVTATGPGGTRTRYTASDGCAVFMFSSDGTYTLSVDRFGYVNSEGIRAVSKTAALELGRIKVLPFSYERSASVRVGFTTSPGYALPDPLPGLSLFNSGLAAPGVLLADAGQAAPVTVWRLWPFADGYSVWASTCNQGDPAQNSLGYPRPTAVAVAAGEQSSAVVHLGPVEVRAVAGLAGPPAADVGIVAVPALGDGCRAGDDQLSLGSTGADGVLRTSLPAGTWVLAPASPRTCDLSAPEGSCPVTTAEVVVVDATGGQPDGTPVVVADLVVTP